jgi:hypothetical protein
MAWFVTDPELLATGAALALTPPTEFARTFVGDNKPIPSDASNTRLTLFFKNFIL